MDYTWNPEKDLINRRRHGMPLAAGIPALQDPNGVQWIDTRFDYGEERLVTIGVGLNGILVVVTVEYAEDHTHIISVRDAERHEARWYRDGYTPAG